MGTCSKCGISIECTLNKACWCHNYPHIPISINESDCLCPNCLELQMARKINNSEIKLTENQVKQIADLGHADHEALKKDIDFSTNDAGMMVLSKWYLLKRGYCCENGCVNCPY